MTRMLDPLTPEFNALVKETLAKWHVPGLSIGIVHGSECYKQSYGFARLPDQKMTCDTLLFTASTTKAFTAAAMSLVIDDTAEDDAPIKWNTPLASRMRDDFVLESEYATVHTTVEDALSHRTGMPRHDLSIGSDLWTHEDDVRNFRNLPLTAEPRTKYQYCNIMFHAAALFIERVTKLELHEVLTNRVWRPLGMNRTFLRRRDAEAAANGAKSSSIAIGYAWDNTHKEFVEYAPKEWSELSGAGATISNVSDYTNWVRCLLNQLTPLSQKGHAELKSLRIHTLPARDPFTGPQSYGLGLRRDIYRGYEIFWHGGDIPGFGTHLCFIPAKNWGLIMMANAQENANYAEQILAFELIDDLLETPVEQRFNWIGYFEEKVAQYYEHLKNAKERLYPENLVRFLEPTLPLKAYTGVYRHPGYRTISISIDTASQTLRAECLDRMLTFNLEFEHVNGDFFIAYMRHLKDKPDRDLFVFEDAAKKAQFRLGVSGAVVQMGLGLESEMGEQLLWFDKI